MTGRLPTGATSAIVSDGLVVWPDLPRLRSRGAQGEALAALILGKIDAFEISRFEAVEPEASAIGIAC